LNRDNKKDNRFRSYLLILMLLACSRGEALGAQDRQALHGMRTLATRAAVNALLYYNLNGTPYEAENIEVSTRELERLHEMATQVGDASLIEQVRRFDNAVVELKHLPQSIADARQVQAAYTRWLPAVVEGYSNLERLLTEHYDAAPDPGKMQDELHELSQNIGQMLISYQLASFPNFGGDLWILDDQALASLDSSIERQFAELSARGHDLSTTLNAPQRDYHFVRPRLLEPSRHWAPNAVALYLMKAMTALDDEVRRLGTRSR
jgi:hypothetical protein